ncbi:MAG: hypothetical protein JWN44_4424 [Myxococcales bacterium]|nr:hypothetical protein [Myxococcales bacterium]
MAQMVRFAVHRGKLISAVWNGGDERVRLELPEGWEELVPRDIIKGEANLDRWIRLDLDQRLAELTPPGFKPTKGLRQP